jgi:hypothetical protein
MLQKTQYTFDIQPIIEQVTQLNITERTALNYTLDGDLFGGEYITCPQYVDTPLGNVLASIEDIGEARLLPLGQTESYHAHRDPDDRYHLSIITNSYSYLADLEDNRLYHLPADGVLWLMDTSILHSAVNLTGQRRIQLNIRKKLPMYRGGGYKLTFTSDRYDWVHQFYVTALGYINQCCKKGSITGIYKESDNVLLLNCRPEVVTHVSTELLKEHIVTTVEML